MDTPSIVAHSRAEALINIFKSMETMQIDSIFNSENMTFGPPQGYHLSKDGLWGYPESRCDNLAHIQSFALDTIKSLSIEENIKDRTETLCLIYTAFAGCQTGLENLKAFRNEANFYHSAAKINKLVLTINNFVVSVKMAINLSSVGISTCLGSSALENMTKTQRTAPINKAGLKPSPKATKKAPPPPCNKALSESQSSAKIKIFSKPKEPKKVIEKDANEPSIQEQFSKALSNTRIAHAPNKKSSSSESWSE